MIYKKISGILATLLLLASFGTTTFAAENKAILTNHPTLTDEQKAEMKSKHDEMNEKWSALTDAQKEKIFKLMDQDIDIKIKTIEEYLSLGLIDQETATEIKTRLNEKKAKMRENNIFPMMDRKG